MMKPLELACDSARPGPQRDALDQHCSIVLQQALDPSGRYWMLSVKQMLLVWSTSLQTSVQLYFRWTPPENLAGQVIVPEILKGQVTSFLSP